MQLEQNTTHGPAQCVFSRPLECQQRQNAERYSLKCVYPHTETLLGLHPNPNNHNNVTFSLQLPPLAHPPSASPPYLSFLMGMRQINVNTGFTYHTVASTTLQGIEWKQTASPFNAGCEHSTAGAQTCTHAGLTGCTACSLWGCWLAASVNASHRLKKSLIIGCHDTRISLWQNTDMKKMPDPSRVSIPQRWEKDCFLFFYPVFVPMFVFPKPFICLFFTDNRNTVAPFFTTADQNFALFSIRGVTRPEVRKKSSVLCRCAWSEYAVVPLWALIHQHQHVHINSQSLMKLNLAWCPLAW